MQKLLDVSAEPTSRSMLPENTLVDILRWRASFSPDDISFRFFRDGAQETSRLSYRELNDAASQIAAFLG